MTKHKRKDDSYGYKLQSGACNCWSQHLKYKKINACTVFTQKSTEIKKNLDAKEISI
jgi:hypothetical protein